MPRLIAPAPPSGTYAPHAFDVVVVYEGGLYKALGRGLSIAADANPWPVFDAAIASQTDRSASILVGRMEAVFDGNDGGLQLGNATRIQGIGGLMSEQVNASRTHTYQPQTVLDFSAAAIDGLFTPDDAAITYRCHGIYIGDLLIIGSGPANAKSGIFFNKNELAEAALTDFIGKVGLSHVNRVYVEDYEVGVNFDNTADSCWLTDSHIHNAKIGARLGSSENRARGNSIWSLTGAGARAIETTGDRHFITGNEIEPGATVDGIVLDGDHNIVQGNSFGPVLDAITCGAASNDNDLRGNTFWSVAGVRYDDSGTNNRRGEFTGVRATRSTTQSLATATEEYISFDTEAYDNGSFHDLVTNPSRITIPAWVVGRRVRLTAVISYDSNATGRRFCKIVKNRTTTIAADSRMANSSGGTAISVVGEDIPTVAGDYYELNARQESGGALNALNAAAAPLYLAMEVLDA